MTSFSFLVPDLPFTRALLDSAVRVEGFDVKFEARGDSGPAASARLRGRIEPELAGAEQVIPDYLVRLSRGVGQPLVALPVFWTRGMVHRKYVSRRGGPAPHGLEGARIGVSRLLAATAVYLRGVLGDCYGLQRQRVRWVAAEPFESDDALEREWVLTERRLGMPAPHLLDLLARGELDAVLYPGGGGGNWYQWVGQTRGESPSHYGDLESLVRERPQLEFSIGGPQDVRQWARATGIYPVFHMVAVHRSLAEGYAGLVSALFEACRAAGERAPEYLSAEERRLYDREMELLGFDPNIPGLTPANVRAIEYLLNGLTADGLLASRPSLPEIFPYAFP